MPDILVIGASGRVGREVVEQLPAARALVRRQANFSGNVEMVYGDLTQPDTLDAALDGIRAVFLVWTAPFEAFAPAWDRIARRVRHVVYLSAPLKTPHPFFQQPNSLRADAENIERMIEASGIDWTFLRPGIFAANALHFWGPQIRAGQTIYWPYLDTPTPPIHERDIAAVGVRALLDRGHAGAEYVITGPQSLTQAEQIDIIGEVIGRQITKENVSHEEGLEIIPVEHLLDAWRAGQGRPALLTNTFEQVTGRPPRSFREWAVDHRAAFMP